MTCKKGATAGCGRPCLPSPDPAATLPSRKSAPEARPAPDGHSHYPDLFLKVKPNRAGGPGVSRAAAASFGACSGPPQTRSESEPTAIIGMSVRHAAKCTQWKVKPEAECDWPGRMKLSASMHNAKVRHGKVDPCRLPLQSRRRRFRKRGDRNRWVASPRQSNAAFGGRGASTKARKFGKIIAMIVLLGLQIKDEIDRARLGFPGRRSATLQITQ